MIDWQEDDGSDAAWEALWRVPREVWTTEDREDFAREGAQEENDDELSG